MSAPRPIEESTKLKSQQVKDLDKPSLEGCGINHHLSNDNPCGDNGMYASWNKNPVLNNVKRSLVDNLYNVAGGVNETAPEILRMALNKPANRMSMPCRNINDWRLQMNMSGRFPNGEQGYQNNPPNHAGLGAGGRIGLYSSAIHPQYNAPQRPPNGFFPYLKGVPL
jgi:hypothetical protein